MTSSVGDTGSKVGPGVAVGGTAVAVGGTEVGTGVEVEVGGGASGLLGVAVGGTAVAVVVGVGVGVAISHVSVLWQREHCPRGWPGGREWQELQLVYVSWSNAMSSQLPVLWQSEHWPGQ